MLLRWFFLELKIRYFIYPDNPYVVVDSCGWAFLPKLIKFFYALVWNFCESKFNGEFLIYI